MAANRTQNCTCRRTLTKILAFKKHICTFEEIWKKNHFKEKLKLTIYMHSAFVFCIFIHFWDSTVPSFPEILQEQRYSQSKPKFDHITLHTNLRTPSTSNYDSGSGNDIIMRMEKAFIPTTTTLYLLQQSQTRSTCRYGVSVRAERFLIAVNYDLKNLMLVHNYVSELNKMKHFLCTQQRNLECDIRASCC